MKKKRKNKTNKTIGKKVKIESQNFVEDFIIKDLKILIKISHYFNTNIESKKIQKKTTLILDFLWVY